MVLARMGCVSWVLVSRVRDGVCMRLSMTRRFGCNLCGRVFARKECDEACEDGAHARGDRQAMGLMCSRVF